MHADHPSSDNQARISVLAIVWVKLSTRHFSLCFVGVIKWRLRVMS